MLLQEIPNMFLNKAFGINQQIFDLANYQATSSA